MTSLLQRDVLVISQKAKLIEMTNEYRILDPEGEEVGAIREEGQSKAKKLLRFVSDVDQFLTHRLSVYEADGTKLLEIVRPAKIFKSTLQIRDAGGTARGAIVQENVIGKKRFALRGPGDEPLGSIDAENWRSWDFAIHDAERDGDRARHEEVRPASSGRGSRRRIITSWRSPGRRQRTCASCSSHRPPRSTPRSR